MKLLIGGSPCTHWSIAQTKHRETEPAGLGWELFKNYLIAREKFKPDFFLYENNKSMSKAIRAQITKELGVEPILINSALVSAQNRQRLYWAGKRNPDGTYSALDVSQPEDREILLRDILETVNKEKGYALKAECINPLPSGKSRTVDAHMGKLEGNLIPRMNDPNPAKQQYDCVVEPIRVGTIENDAKNQEYDSQQYRVYSPDGKSVTLCGAGGGWEPRRDCMQSRSTNDAGARSDQTGICGHPPRKLCRPVLAEQQNKEGQINE